MSIAVPLAKTYGMNKALDIAYKKLGIQKPDPLQTEVDILSGGGIQSAFSPGNLANAAKRAALNLGIRSIGSKGFGKALGALGPLGLVAGIAFLGNKYRKQLTGYNTQAEYEAARDARIANKRLSRITDRILAGKNYGNYEKALTESGAGAVDIDGTITYGTDYFGETKSKDKKSYSGPTGQDIHGGGGGGGHAGGAAAAAGAAAQAADDAAAGAGGYRRGGIAGL